MPINDQCQRCIHMGTSSCPEGANPLSFDGRSCESYSRKTPISLEKSEDTLREAPDNNDKPEPVTPTTTPVPTVATASDESPSGWLAFFLFFSMPLGAIAGLFTNIVSYSAEDYGFVDLGLSVLLLGLAILTIVRFVKHKEDSVILAKTYLVVCFCINLLVLIAGGNDSSLIARLVRSTISAVLWFWYFSASEQVERLIPKATRKHTILSKWVIAIFVLAPIVFIGYVTSKTTQDQKAMLEEITSDKLRAGEYTDGRIIFRPPYGYDIESQQIEGLTVFSISDTETTSYTVCSDFTDEFSEAEFNDYWENWVDEDLADIEYDIDRASQISVNGNPAYFKVVKYHTDYPIYWYYAIVYNEETCKEAVVSSYKLEDEYSSDFIDFLNSIEFHRK